MGYLILEGQTSQMIMAGCNSLWRGVSACSILTYYHCYHHYYTKNIVTTATTTPFRVLFISYRNILIKEWKGNDLIVGL